MRHDPSQRESYAAILARHGLPEVSGEGGVDMVDMPNDHRVNAFGAQFVEVRVDPDLGLVRVARALGVFDIGTVLNQKTARSQGVGGIVWGIGMAVLEHSTVHPVHGKFASPNLSDYLVPVHADVPAIDALFVEERDPYVNSLGAKGVGEIAIVGVAAAGGGVPCHRPARWLSAADAREALWDGGYSERATGALSTRMEAWTDV